MANTNDKRLLVSPSAPLNIPPRTISSKRRDAVSRKPPCRVAATTSWLAVKSPTRMVAIEPCLSSCGVPLGPAMPSISCPLSRRFCAVRRRRASRWTSPTVQPGDGFCRSDIDRRSAFRHGPQAHQRRRRDGAPCACRLPEIRPRNEDQAPSLSCARWRRSRKCAPPRSPGVSGARHPRSFYSNRAGSFGPAFAPA